MTGLFVAVILGVLLAGYLMTLYNHLVFLRNQAEKAWYNIDVLLKQRHDEIPKLVAVCEGSAKFEKATLEQVMAARHAAAAASGVAARAQAEGGLSQALGRLLAVAEAYPELKTIDLFSRLQARCSSLESEIADRREFYNDSTTLHNTALETFPTNYVATWGAFRPRDLFKVAAADTADVEVKLNV